MKKNKASVSLDEVFAWSEKDPRWKAAYAKAGIEVRLAIQIAKARAKSRMTQGQLAKAIGTTQSVISRIERANQNLTLKTLGKIASVLHADLIVQLRYHTGFPS
ncbi:MAG: helix-turn-helix transcriptional regulator [Elusimicrobiota bacterium]|nr:helix-turn-helix transcriptional regulator [Elusimicrobiota bacterium]